MLLNPAMASLADQDNAHPGEWPNPALTGVGHPPTLCGHSSEVSQEMRIPHCHSGCAEVPGWHGGYGSIPGALK